jgi:hypothetical protein
MVCDLGQHRQCPDPGKAATDYAEVERRDPQSGDRCHKDGPAPRERRSQNKGPAERKEQVCWHRRRQQQSPAAFAR